MLTINTPSSIHTPKKALVAPLYTQDIQVGIDELKKLVIEHPEKVLVHLRSIRDLFKEWALGTTIAISEQKIPVHDARFQSRNDILELVVDTSHIPYNFNIQYATLPYTKDEAKVIFQLGSSHPGASITKDNRHTALPGSKGSPMYHIYSAVTSFGGQVADELVNDLANQLDIKIVPNIDLGSGERFIFRIGRPTRNIDATKVSMMKILSCTQSSPHVDTIITGGEAKDNDGISDIIESAQVNHSPIIAMPNKILLSYPDIIAKMLTYSTYISLNCEELIEYHNLINPQNSEQLLSKLKQYRGDDNQILQLVIDTFIKIFPHRNKEGNTIITMEGSGACCIGYDKDQLIAIHTNTIDSHDSLIQELDQVCCRHNKTLEKHINSHIQNPIGCGDSVMAGIVQKRQSKEVDNIMDNYQTIDFKTKELLIDGLTAQLFGYLTYHCAYTNIFQLKDEDKLGAACFEECIQVIKSYYHASIDKILSEYSKFSGVNSTTLPA